MKSKIITLPASILRQSSQKVGIIDDKIKSIVEEMIEQAKLWEQDKPNEITVGLAAVQINIPLKIVIIRQNSDTKAPPIFDVLINPKIIKLSGPKSCQIEGCLSVAGYYCQVERYETVKVEALDLDNNLFRFKADGFLARILQHEIDHLKGITIVDKAVEAADDKGRLIKFCRLTTDSSFEPVEDSELQQKGLL